MPTLRNTNPLGQVDLPLIGRQGDPVGETGSGCLEPGEEFEVSDADAAKLLEQDGNYAPVDPEAQTIADQIAADRAELERARGLFQEAVAQIQAEIPDPPGGVPDAAVFGEKGPEVLQLPRGTRITPVDTADKDTV